MKKHQALLSPCALGWTCGIFCAVNFLLYVLFASASINFLWYNPAMFDIVVRMIPEWIPITYWGAVIAGVYGMVTGGILGIVVGMVYNWRINRCQCRWCQG